MKRRALLIGGGILIIILIVLFSWHPKIHLSSNTYHRIDTEEKVLVLTFDDGPGEETTAILDILLEKNVTATFFIVGERIPWYSEEMKRIVAEGHSIGLHSYSHKNPLFGGKKDLYQEIIAFEGIYEYSYYRPPYGLRNPLVTRQAKAQELNIIVWDIMPRDFSGWDAERISNYVLKKIRKGSIITLHEGPENRKETVKALPMIIDGAREKGYEFVSLETENT